MNVVAGEMKDDADAYDEEVVQEPVEENHITETHLILHLYTTNGGTTNNFDLINPTDELTDLISQEMNKIHKYSLTKQSLQEAFGEASGTWSDIKQLLDNYVKDNTPKPFGAKLSEFANRAYDASVRSLNNAADSGQQGVNAISESANTRARHFKQGVNNIKDRFFGIKSAKIHSEIKGGSRKMKKTRKIRRK